MKRAPLVAALLAAVLAVPASAQAKSLYVSGSGTGAGACADQASACTLAHAIVVAVNGDTVLIDGSAGPVVTTGQTISEGLALRSLDAAAARPVIAGAPGPGLPVLSFAAGSDGANLSGLDLRNTKAVSAGTAVTLAAPGVTVQDSTLTSTGPGLFAFFPTSVVRRTTIHGGALGASMPGTIVNSVVTASGPGATALSAPGTATLTAVNVTAIATGTGSTGILASEATTFGAPAGAITARNVIARGELVDVRAGIGSAACPPVLILPCASGTVAIDHSNFVTKGGALTEGAGNTSADPLFASPTDLHLQAASPLRDAGVEDALSGPVDIEGSPRRDGAGVDVGAYEFLIPLPPKNPAPGPLAPSGPAPDTAAPGLGVVRLTNARFRVGPKTTALSAAQRRRKAKRTPVGTTVTVGVTERSTLNFDLQRLTTGRVSGKACVTAKRKLRKAKRCTRATPVDPGFDRAAPRPGAVKLVFSGRLGSFKLKPGRYRFLVTATDPSGNRSAPRTASFTIVRR